MDDHDARNHGTIDSCSDSPAPVLNGKPRLSAADRNSLAERIALIDAVTCAQAHREIEEFMSIDLGTLIGLPAEAKVERVAGQGPTAPSAEEPLPWACAT